MRATTICVVLLFTTPAFASDAGPTSLPAKATRAAPQAQPQPQATSAVQQSWWQVLLVEAIKVTAFVFTPVLGLLLAWLLRKMGLKIELDQAVGIAKLGTGFAEQAAAKALKEGKPKTDHAEKASQALGFANDLAAKYKLKTRARDKMESLIESALGMQKLEAEKKPQDKVS